MDTEDASEFLRLPCDHEYHKSCMAQYVDFQTRHATIIVYGGDTVRVPDLHCPVCRRAFGVNHDDTFTQVAAIGCLILVSGAIMLLLAAAVVVLHPNAP